MIKEQNSNNTKILVNEVIKGIQEKKGLSIICLNLAEIKSTVCDYFVICHGTSNTHVGAIADSVEEQVKKQMGLKPRIMEGKNNSEWILIDYLDVVVHVFQEQIRDYYKLEDLWADAPFIEVDNDVLISI